MKHKLESALLGEISVTSDMQITLPYDRKQREIEESLAPWRKSCGKPWQHIEKERHHFADKGLYSQSYDFSSTHVWMWELNHTECWRIDFFQLWCWIRLLRVPWTARRSNQSILKEINLTIHWKDWCWSWRSNPLATWCEELSHWKRLWFCEILKAGGEGGNRGWDGWMTPSTQRTLVWATSRREWRTGKPGLLHSIGLQRVGHNLATKQQQQHLHPTYFI